jgi:dolichyl-phosphate-mannose--protein O-mannosyl transferase
MYFVDPILSRDGIYYLYESMGIRVEDYLLLFGQQPPLFISILTAFQKLGISAELGALAVNIICGSLLCVIVWMSCREMHFPKKICNLCAILVAIHPELARNSHELQRETLYLFFSSIVIYCLTVASVSRRTSKRFNYTALLGVMGAMTVSFRYEGWELLLIALIWFGFCDIFIKKRFFELIIKELLIVLGWTVSLLIILFVCQYPVNIYFQNALGYL